MTNHLTPASLDGQLSLFQDEGALPIPSWRGKTPPEMRADAPEGYRLDLSGEEPLYVLDEHDAPLPAEEGDEPFDDDAEPEADDTDGPNEDDDAVDDTQQWSAPRRVTAQAPSP